MEVITWVTTSCFRCFAKQNLFYPIFLSMLQFYETFKLILEWNGFQFARNQWKHFLGKMMNLEIKDMCKLFNDV